MTTRSHDLVMEFQTTFKRDIGDINNPSIDTGHEELRHKLIAEEISETLTGIMFNDDVEIVDGCGDMEYVIQGAAITFGFVLDPTAYEHLFFYAEAEHEIIGLLVTTTSALHKMLNYENRYPNAVELLLNSLLVLVRKYADLATVQLDEALEVIHQSNMSKLDEQGEPIINDWGKIMKGPNFWEPKEKIKELIERGKVELPAA